MKRMRGFRIFKDLGTPLVHVVGDHLKTGLESVNQHSRAEPDHLWITMDPGLSLRVTISVNTLSLRNQDAGFDPRVRVGIVQGTWEHLPERGIEECHRFSYEELAGIDSVDFIPLERVLLEQLLMDKIQRARSLEVWGTPYHREMPGIHQIHSRRASCAVPESVDGRDGALRFHYAEGQRTETVLMKFCGQ